MENREEKEQTWLSKAALFELLAFALRLPTEELSEVVSSGEYADALEELAELNGLNPDVVEAALSELKGYEGANSESLFHELRIEYTHLFVGAPKSAVSPFAGIWWAEETGVEPLLFVNKESMAVERFMRSCGVGQPEGTNNPLDHIASELEFLQYLSMLRAGAELPTELPEGFTMPEEAYENFFETHFAGWSKKLAAAVLEEARIPFYKAIARVLAILP